ncbi:MAG: DUF4965 domain-containing protein [Ignavibacteria bacterium]|nr:DUF4965 domain-containing protein [Ignavibacteria bacterium]
MKTTAFCLLVTLVSAAQMAPLLGQPLAFRAPATPLVTCDPYFSIWSFADHPADDWPRHWTGTNNALCSIVRIDGASYRLVGRAPSNIPAMTLASRTVLPTRTIYEFTEAGVHLTLTSLTPLLPHDLNIISRPVAYVSWQVRSIDGKEHAVSIYYDNSAELVVNTADQRVTWSRFQNKELDILRIGSQEQPILQKSGDNLRIDWGHLYVVSPKTQQAASVVASHHAARNAFTRTGDIPFSDDMRAPRKAHDDWPVLAYAFNLGHVGSQTVKRFLLLAYDDEFSIQYFHRNLRPYWRATGMTTEELLKRSVQEYGALSSQCKTFDEELMADLGRVGGEQYALLAALAYRQAIAAQKLTADIDGTPLLFPKENFSNGCIATVDVIYPAAPIFMLFNVDLLKATVTPVFQYASMKQWRFPFAPHDLGTYPHANGQVYGGGEVSEENQMPVEECGNMLILAYAIAHMEGTAEYASRYWSSLEQWARYLKEKGLDPENQLCTDDFAGHLAHNVNLSLKAILALGSYSRLCLMLGKKKEAEEYWKIAQQFARNWERMANDGDHYRLAFDKPGTWSQKYNLVWDKLLALNLFPREIARKEIAYYKSKQNPYGLPLDNRKDYTKLDWLVWTATLAESRVDFGEIVSRAYAFANETPNRVPLTDWYDTKTAKQVGFQARSVVGGVFIKMLDDPAVWRKWSERRMQ